MSITEEEIDYGFQEVLFAQKLLKFQTNLFIVKVVRTCNNISTEHISELSFLTQCRREVLKLDTNACFCNSLSHLYFKQENKMRYEIEYFVHYKSLQ